MDALFLLIWIVVSWVLGILLGYNHAQCKWYKKMADFWEDLRLLLEIKRDVGQPVTADDYHDVIAMNFGVGRD